LHLGEAHISWCLVCLVLFASSRREDITSGHWDALSGLLLHLERIRNLLGGSLSCVHAEGHVLSGGRWWSVREAATISLWVTQNNFSFASDVWELDGLNLEFFGRDHGEV
jgi:hypothetical protein